MRRQLLAARRRPRAALVTAATGIAVAAAMTGTSAAAGNPWPSNPHWTSYVEAPTSANVRPVKVVSTTGEVTNAAALTKAGSGVTTMTATKQTLTAHPVTVSFPDVQARYVRLDVTKLGLAPAGDPAGVYLQLAEMQVLAPDGTTNLAQGQPVTASESIVAAGWNPTYLTDGVTDSDDSSAHGYTSQAHSSADVSSSPVWVTIDLGSVQSVGSVVLWPRTDTLSDDGRTASFPVDFSVQTSATDDQSGSFTAQKSVAGQADPQPPTLSGDASIILDYGKDVGGYPTFDVTAADGNPTLQAGYSETRRQLTPRGDGVTPWASGDSQRYDTYTVSGPGVITNSQIQGGERYEEITLTSPGTISLSSAGIVFTPYLAGPSRYAGTFVSSSGELNKYWYDGVYTAELNQMPAGTAGPNWHLSGGALDVPGTTAGTALLRSGAAWTDYTASVETKIVNNQAGWMVRGQDATHGYLFILDDSTDTASGPGANVLQVLSEDGGNYHTIANVPLADPIAAGTWHQIATAVDGTTVTTSIDGTQVDTFDSAAFPAGTPAYDKGSFGIREFTPEEAQFRNLRVASSSATLYDNPLTAASAIATFNIPGDNAVPLILDGAKRDRAVWVGDLAVEGPTLYYSTGTSSYIRGSLELLGSYAGSNGYVTGDMPPTTPINTAAPGATVNGYSASYSMYFVKDLAEYYRYTADTAFVRREWPIVQRELAWSAAQVDAHGLLSTNGSDGADWDYYDATKTGEVTEYNALYYETLRDGAQLASVLGRGALARQYDATAVVVRHAINQRLFNTRTGVYDVSDSVRGVIAQDANVVAIDAGVAPAAKVKGILAVIKKKLWTAHGTKPFSTSDYKDLISPYISGFELTARLGSGDTADAMSLLSREWGPMIAPGDDDTGTFWENESTSGTQGWDATSMAHGWSTMPTSALSEYVLGIRPASAGYKTWLVQPHAGSLKWVEGRAPTPHGKISVDWSHAAAAGHFTMLVRAPKATSGTIAVPTFGRTITITVNGRTAWKNGRLVRGEHRITSASRADGYISLHVSGGSYTIRTTSK